MGQSGGLAIDYFVLCLDSKRSLDDLAPNSIGCYLNSIRLALPPRSAVKSVRTLCCTLRSGRASHQESLGPQRHGLHNSE
jgi:hypothetical protein